MEVLLKTLEVQAIAVAVQTRRWSRNVQNNIILLCLQRDLNHRGLCPAKTLLVRFSKNGELPALLLEFLSLGQQVEKMSEHMTIQVVSWLK